MFVHPLLLPLIITQGLWVKMKTPRLPEPPGKREGVLDNGKTNLSILIIGDSSAAGVGVSHQDQALLGQLIQLCQNTYNVRYKLFAYNGATTEEMLEKMKGFTEQFDIIITALGVNDVKKMLPKETWYQQTNALLHTLQRNCFPKQIIVSGIPPMGSFPALPKALAKLIGNIASEYEAGLLELVEKHQCQHINFQIELPPEAMASDGFHPGADIYHWWAQQVYEKVNTL